MNAIADAIVERHRDMYIYTTRSLRLPISGMGLKDIAAHFGFRRQSSIRDGMEALVRYDEYRRVRNKNKKRALRDELVAYNLDDVRAVVATVEKLGALALQGGLTAPALPGLRKGATVKPSRFAAAHRRRRAWSGRSL